MNVLAEKILKHAAKRMGYRLVPRTAHLAAEVNAVLYKYVRTDGSFDYERYRLIQQAGNKQKLEQVWAKRENIEFLAGYIRHHLGDVSFGLCHGTRRGLEQAWFSEALRCSVVGTEISDTATQFPNTIQWDFHEVKDEWLNSVDFIYSNSFDHAYDPQRCLSAWVSCLRPGGICIIEHSTASGAGGANELDPFGAELVEMPYLVLRWGAGRYSVREILDAPVKNDSLGHLVFLIVHRHDQDAAPAG